MKLQDRNIIKGFTEYTKALRSDVAVDSMPEGEKIKKKAELEKNTLEWIKFFFPKYLKYKFAKFHLKAIKRLTENAEWLEVLSWSRELAKTTTVMFCVMYLILTGRKKNVLFVSNTRENAVRLMNNYRKAFENNPIIKAIYGELKTYGDWSENEFILSNGAVFRAIGAGESPRGTNNEGVRPDVIIVDDFDTDQECRNIDILNKKWQWYEEALIPTRSVSEPLLVVWCGNIIAKDCCVVRAGKKADNWDIVNIVDKNGVSSWIEKNTQENIDRIKNTISTKAFQQEYMNTPLQEGDVFKSIVWGKCPPLTKCQNVVAYGDPAPSNSKNKASSYKACFLIGYYDGKFYVYTGFLDHVVNDQYVDWYYDLKAYAGQGVQVYNYIENNKLQDPFYEQVFLPLFAAKGRERGFIGIIPDTRKKPDKFERIEGNLEPLNRLGRLILNENEKNNPNMQRLEEQFLLINKAMKSPADGVDCIEGGVYILNEMICTLKEESYTIIQKKSNNKRY